LPAKSYSILVLPFLLAVLMVSTFKYHALKEVSSKQGTPFWFLVAVVTGLVLIFIYPEVVMFIFAALYVMWGMAEGFIRYRNDQRRKQIEEKEIEG
jgi:phosphatidylserine synthase